MTFRKVDTHRLPLTEKHERATRTHDPKQILDEDEYAENVEKIIQRDFFPDLETLQDQSEYFDAIDKNDLVKLRQMQIKFANRRPTTGRSTLYTPSTFETPEPSEKPSSPVSSGQDTASDAKLDDGTEHIMLKDAQDQKNIGLDKYLSKYTSEDNASFNEILKENERKHRDKHAWLHEAEEKLAQAHNERLSLPDIEQQVALEAKSAALDLWEYKTRNALMYVPDGVEKSQKEQVEEKKINPREIIYSNTRFTYDPHNRTKSHQSIQQAAADKANMFRGKIGHDGKEIVMETPKVNGYCFVGTPSPAPGVDESPLLTWGEIEGTPFRVDGSATPALLGPLFKIPDVPDRDRIGMELAERASKAHRAKKQEALKHATKNLSRPPHKFGQSNTEKLSSLSPAAQRLATAKLGIRTNTDKALRESYTPSSSHRLSGSKTPVLLTPGSCSTPASQTCTPGSSRGAKHESDINSLTDNLLNLPKRQRASDFFS